MLLLVEVFKSNILVDGAPIFFFVVEGNYFLNAVIDINGNVRYSPIKDCKIFCALKSELTSNQFLAAVPST